MIGILTLHYGYNEGAILQAYALAASLKSAGAVQALIVDHRYPKKTDIYRRNMDGRKAALDHAIEHWLPLTPERFMSDDPGDTWRYVERNFSALVVGSDQVWRVRYVPRWFGLAVDQPDPFIGSFPNVYWPPENVCIPKYSYAASVGDAPLGPIPREHRRCMASVLKDFRIIGVRDRRTADFVASLSRDLEHKIALCPDPTLLHSWEVDQASVTLRQKLASCGLADVDSICVLGLEPSAATAELASELAKAGFTTVGYGSSDTYSKVKLARIGLTPLEWVALFDFASLCVTDRMHAFIFCMLRRCPCVVIDRAGTTEGALTRISDFAASIGYSDQVFLSSASKEAIVGHLLSFKPDWEHVASRLQAIREQGLKVIRQIVK